MQKYRISTLTFRMPYNLIGSVVHIWGGSSIIADVEMAGGLIFFELSVRLFDLIYLFSLVLDARWYRL